jgi:hypothetical protein
MVLNDFLAGQLPSRQSLEVVFEEGAQEGAELFITKTTVNEAMGKLSECSPILVADSSGTSDNSRFKAGTTSIKLHKELWSIATVPYLQAPCIAEGLNPRFHQPD